VVLKPFIGARVPPEDRAPLTRVVIGRNNLGTMPGRLSDHCDLLGAAVAGDFGRIALRNDNLCSRGSGCPSQAGARTSAGAQADLARRLAGASGSDRQYTAFSAR
jgi:hypothetical protein